MANSELLNNRYKLPDNILKYIQATLVNNSNNNGIKRAKFLIKNKSVTYQDLKRLKNFFDYFNSETDDKIQYALAGGDLMKNFIETTLNSERNAIKTEKKVHRDINIDLNLGTKPYKPNLNLHEENDRLNIDNYDKLDKNALAVIVNDDNKILLLKRSGYEKQWQPHKWGLVGGSVEENEEPDDACSREIMEETCLEINKNDFTERVVIHRNPNSVEHIFTCRYSGELTDITLNEEHTNYGWFDVAEMKYLDTVPNLIEYISLVFKAYE
jgi:ADP-ribose pyrophosphatase YjhB (NUDIX family)